MSPDTLSVLLRAASLVLLAQGVGGVLFLALAGHLLAQAASLIRRGVAVAALAAVLLLALNLLLQAARLGGDYGALLDASLQRLAWSSTGARAQVVQAAGLLLLARAAAPGSGALPAVSGVLLAVGSFALTGHTSVSPLRGLLAPLLVLHVLIAAFWFGSLLPLLLVVRWESRAVASVVLRRFSAVAVWLVPGLALLGSVLAVALCGGLPAATQGYGRLLGAKVLLYLLLLALAAVNKFRLLPGLSRGAATVRPLRRTLQLEAVLIAGVLLLTTVLTQLYSPGD